MVDEQPAAAPGSHRGSRPSEASPAPSSGSRLVQAMNPLSWRNGVSTRLPTATKMPIGHSDAPSGEVSYYS